MGRTICSAVAADPDLVFVAGVDPGGAGETIDGVVVDEHLRAFADTECDVVVDFTVADAARVTLPWLAMHGIHAVVGTTGLSDDDLALRCVRRSATAPHCLLAPNFAISAVLMIRFAELAAPFFDTAEIIEIPPRPQDRRAVRHCGQHRRAHRRRAGRVCGADPTEHEVYAGARGGTAPGGVHVHSVRMHGMVAHQDVIFGRRAVAHDPSGQLRPRELHAGRRAGVQAHRRPSGRARTARPVPRLKRSVRTV